MKSLRVGGKWPDGAGGKRNSKAEPDPRTRSLKGPCHKVLLRGEFFHCLEKNQSVFHPHVSAESSTTTHFVHTLPYPVKLFLLFSPSNPAGLHSIPTSSGPLPGGSIPLLPLLPLETPMWAVVNSMLLSTNLSAFLASMLWFHTCKSFSPNQS